MLGFGFGVRLSSYRVDFACAWGCDLRKLRKTTVVVIPAGYDWVQAQFGRSHRLFRV